MRTGPRDQMNQIDNTLVIRGDFLLHRKNCAVQPPGDPVQAGDGDAPGLVRIVTSFSYGM